MARDLHSQHVKAAQQWERDTQGKDWRLVNHFRESNAVRVYEWEGPGDTYLVFEDTVSSMRFLYGLHRSLAAYRLAFARRVTGGPTPERQPEHEPTVEEMSRTI